MRPHWFETGTPTFLLDLMRRRGFDAPQLEGMEVTDRLLGSFDVGAVVYCYFAALGVDLIPEDTTSHGRIDLMVRHRGRVWLIEFKVNELSQPGRALEQLKARNYAACWRYSSLNALSSASVRTE